jgi:hypothetical protein
MAQKDAKVNIDLAKDTSYLARASKEDSAVMRTIATETKKDGSSMKTIAVLGMLFLPPTFVAVSRLLVKIQATAARTNTLLLYSPSYPHRYSAGMITAFPLPMMRSNTTGLLPCLSHF